MSLSKPLEEPVHWAVRNHGDYDVEMMFKVTERHKVFKIYLSSLQRTLKLRVWRDEDGKPVSPYDVLYDVSIAAKNKHHWNRIVKASLEYPVLVINEKHNWKNINPKDLEVILNEYGLWDLLDGYHRLALAFLLNNSYVLAKELTWEELQQTKIRWSIYRAPKADPASDRFNSVRSNAVVSEKNTSQSYLQTIFPEGRNDVKSFAIAVEELIESIRKSKRAREDDELMPPPKIKK